VDCIRTPEPSVSSLAVATGETPATIPIEAEVVFLIHGMEHLLFFLGIPRAKDHLL